MPEVIIVGAGLAGMSAATRLMEQGFDITLYEQSDFLAASSALTEKMANPIRTSIATICT